MQRTCILQSLEGDNNISEKRPKIGLFPATAIVLGAVIGSGIFVSPASMARSSTSGLQLLWIWAIAGLLTMIGALTQCELCSSMPRSGGLYTYLREAFGDRVAFFYGWANFMIAGSGGIAAVAFIFAAYCNELTPIWHSPEAMQLWQVHIPGLGSLFPLANMGEKFVAVTLVVALTWINTRGVRAGAGVQSVSTSIKMMAMVFIIIVGFSDPQGSTHQIISERSIHNTMTMAQMVGLAVIALSGAFWSYDGWGNIAYIAGEVRRPERTVPRALILGTSIVIVVYLLVNASFLYSFSIQGLGAVPGDRIASALLGKVLGPIGAQIVAVVILVSTFDGTNAGILTNARVYHSMANEGLLPHQVGATHAKWFTPYVALWLQCLWTIVLLVSGSFELIASMYVWVNWLFYFLMAVAVFVCRRRKMSRAFTIWGYPYVPAVFLVFTLLYLGVTLAQDIQSYRQGDTPTVNSLMGLVLVLVGAPLYLYMHHRRKTAFLG